MNSLIYTFLAAGCAAISSLLFRISALRATTSPNGYLVCSYLSAFIFSLGMYPDIWKVPVNFIMLGLGGVVGVFNVLLMCLTARALKRGPAGLTYMIQSSAAVFPGICLFLLFGAEFGYSYTAMQASGLVLVLFGLFWGIRKEINGVVSLTWLCYAVSAFFIQILAYTLIQGRCVLFHGDKLCESIASLSIGAADDIWFIPGQFGAALIAQLIIFLRERRKMQVSEAVFGFLGGSSTFASSCLLLVATKLALPVENAILFPLFAITTIMLCNAWSYKLYNEKFNLMANAACASGIIFATSAA